MREVRNVLIAGLLLAGMCCLPASAAIILDDPLDGSTVGVASGIDWVGGASGNAADKAAGFAPAMGTDYIQYGTAGSPFQYIASQGTVGFLLKSVAAQTIMSTVGSAGVVAGDINLLMMPDSFAEKRRLRLSIYNGAAWSRYLGNTVLDANTWYYVAVSYGGNGVKLYLSGALEPGSWTGANYLGARSSKPVYLGDFPGDSSALGFEGRVDRIRASNVESDANILSAPAVPEPSALAGLIGGLIPALVALKRRRL